MANLTSIERLLGRENYDTWKFAVKTFLEHEGLWKYVVTYDEEKKDEDTKARTKIILLVDPVNYIHIQSATTAKEVWVNLEKAFQDSGLARKVSLLRTLIMTRLDECDSVDEYVNKIISTAHKLRGVGMDVSDEWVGTLLLAGLPDIYKPMIMGIESSGVTISADAIKTKLLQDVNSVNPQNSSSALVVSRQNNKFKKGVKKIRCYECNNYGHMARNCPNKKKQFNKKAVLISSVLVDKADSKSWYIDSGASGHMTMRSEWLINQRNFEDGEIVIANNTRLPVACVGDVEMQLSCGEALIKNVMYVPGLCTNLLSVSEMMKNGNTVEFDSVGCKIWNKSSGTLVATATLEGSLYKLSQQKNSCLLSSSSQSKQI